MLPGGDYYLYVCKTNVFRHVQSRAPKILQSTAIYYPVNENYMQQRIDYQIKALIALGNLKDAILLYLNKRDIDPKDQNKLILLSNQLHLTEDEYNLGLISFKERIKVNNRVTNTILKILDTKRIIEHGSLQNPFMIDKNFSVLDHTSFTLVNKQFLLQNHQIIITTLLLLLSFSLYVSITICR